MPFLIKKFNIRKKRKSSRRIKAKNCEAHEILSFSMCML